MLWDFATFYCQCCAQLGWTGLVLGLAPPDPHLQQNKRKTKQQNKHRKHTLQQNRRKTKQKTSTGNTQQQTKQNTRNKSGGEHRVPGRYLKTTILQQEAPGSPPGPPLQCWGKSVWALDSFSQRWYFLNPGRSTREIAFNIEVGVRGGALAKSRGY
jgi:hypothetical protein